MAKKAKEYKVEPLKVEFIHYDVSNVTNADIIDDLAKFINLLFEN